MLDRLCGVCSPLDPAVLVPEATAAAAEEGAAEAPKEAEELEGVMPDDEDDGWTGRDIRLVKRFVVST